MNTNQNSKKYDLEERTFEYSKKVLSFVKTLPKNMPYSEISSQLFRSATSVGANYIEANESLSKKDYVMRVKICRKECKESVYWLKLLDLFENEKAGLIQEGMELTKIFGSILEKCK
jgi:four helix bundle protein